MQQKWQLHNAFDVSLCLANIYSRRCQKRTRRYQRRAKDLRQRLAHTEVLHLTRASAKLAASTTSVGQCHYTMLFVRRAAGNNFPVGRLS